MEKRVIVFLIVSLAVIIGYDFLLKGMGLVPPPEPTQEVSTTDRAISAGKSVAPEGTSANSFFARAAVAFCGINTLRKYLS